VNEQTKEQRSSAKKERAGEAIRAATMYLAER